MKSKTFYINLLKLNKVKYKVIFNKKNTIYYNTYPQTIITHKGMWLLNIETKKFMHKKRIGEYVFTRKPFKRPNRLKKRKCYLNIFIGSIFLNFFLNLIIKLFLKKL